MPRVQVFTAGQPTWAFVGGTPSHVAPDDQVVDNKPAQPIDYEIIRLANDGDVPPLPDGEYFWNPVSEAWEPLPNSNAGIVGLTNPLVAALNAANNNIDNVNGLAANTVNLRDQGGGAVSLQASPSSPAQLLINGLPISTDSTAPDWAASTLYTAKQLVVDNGVLYRRIATGVSALTFASDAVNWEPLGTSTADLLTDWAPSVAYVLNQEVVNGGLLYRRNAAGISSSTFTADSGNWEQISSGAATSVPNFAPSVLYAANDLIVQDGQLYRRIANGTSGTSFAADAVQWHRLSNPNVVVDDWAAGTAYVAKQLIIDNGLLYRRIAAGTSGATFAIDSTNWQPVSGSNVNLLADWAPATVYVADQEAVESGRLYRRITDGTSLGTFALDQANWEEVGSIPSTIVGNFVPSTAYAQNEVIVQDGKVFRRISSGTSVATFASDTANWEAISDPNTVINDWAAGTAYVADEVVLDGGVLYRRNTAGTSLGTFALDATNWTPVTAMAINAVLDWAPATSYATNEVILEGGLFYRRNLSGISGAAFDAAEAANWTQIGSGVHTAEDWAASTAYVVNQVVVNGGLLYRSNGTRTSGSTFDVAEAANWTLLSEPPQAVSEWIASTSYITNELVVNGGQLYRSLTTRTSTGAFDAAEQTNWQNLSVQTVSSDAEQLLTIGADGLHMLDPDNLVSTDAGNALAKGTDGKLVVTGAGAVLSRTEAELLDSTDPINQPALKTRDALVYVVDKNVYVRPGLLTPQGAWLEGGTTNVFATPTP